MSASKAPVVKFSLAQSGAVLAQNKKAVKKAAPKQQTKRKGK